MKRKDYSTPNIDVVELKPVHLLIGSGPGSGDQSNPTLIYQSDPVFEDVLDDILGF